MGVSNHAIINSGLICSNTVDVVGRLPKDLPSSMALTTKRGTRDKRLRRLIAKKNTPHNSNSCKNLRLIILCPKQNILNMH
jgi:hypothetical protein